MVAVCAEPVPEKVKLLYGEPSEDGQDAPPPLFSVAEEVRPVSTRLPLAGNILPEVFVMVTCCVYLPGDGWFSGPRATDTLAVSSRQPIGMLMRLVEALPMVNSTVSVPTGVLGDRV